VPNPTHQKDIAIGEIMNPCNKLKTHLLQEIQTHICCRKFKHTFAAGNSNTHLLQEIKRHICCRKFKHTSAAINQKTYIYNLTPQMEREENVL
jgi:hypothetical protein